MVVFRFYANWVRPALGKSFHLCRLKNHKNLKPQPERKTFRQKRRVALVGDNCQYQISNLFAWAASDAIEILGPQVDSIFSSSSDHLS